MDLPCFEFGTVHSKYKGFKNQNTKIELSTVQSLVVRLCRCAGLTGSVLVAISVGSRVNHSPVFLRLVR
jgi:hypothetical protein